MLRFPTRYGHPAKSSGWARTGGPTASNAPAAAPGGPNAPAAIMAELRRPGRRHRRRGPDRAVGQRGDLGSGQAARRVARAGRPRGIVRSAPGVGMLGAPQIVGGRLRDATRFANPAAVRSFAGLVRTRTPPVWPSDRRRWVSSKSCHGVLRSLKYVQTTSVVV